MKIDFDSIKPVYVQIAEAIEDDIVSGKLLEGANSYSQISISKELGVNPATAGKGINILVQKGVLVKQRGLAMTVAIGAKDKLITEKKENNLQVLIEELVNEADKIGLEKNDVIKALENFYNRRVK